MLTLCMIVKNEKKSLKNCLAKAAAFVDEIIVVDTGSTDNTKDIAAQFTNKIYDFKWCNDFSKARNFSISKASNDWILILDADEFITDFNKDTVDEFINNPLNKSKVGRIQIINIMEYLSDNKRCMERLSRFFNRNYFHYEGIIHEQLTGLDENDYKINIVDITVEHIGYTQEILNKTNKLKRNIELLEVAVKNDPEDPYLYFQLGKSYYMKKDYKTSNSYFEKALYFQVDFRLEYVEDLIETYGYSLINSGRYSDGLILENCLEVYSNRPDFHFLMGLIYMNNAMFSKAIESFLKAVKFPNGKVEGITTFLPYYNIGVIYEVLGFKDKALKYYKKCGSYVPAVKRISNG